MSYTHNNMRRRGKSERNKQTHNKENNHIIV